MKVINQRFLTQNMVRRFVEESVDRLVEQHPDLTGDKTYWLYYYVKTDFDMILSSLLNYDINSDFLGFPNQQKMLRHQIEAYVDLFNLSLDRNYMLVLQKNNQEDVNLGLYEKYLGKGSFYNIKQKLKIARANGFQYGPYLENYAQNSNRYVHPNVFIEPIHTDEKEKLLRDLLNVSIFLVAEAYQLMLRLYAPEGRQPKLFCRECNQENSDCGCCFSNLITNERYYVAADTGLFEEYHPEDSSIQTYYQ